MFNGCISDNVRRRWLSGNGPRSGLYALEYRQIRREYAYGNVTKSGQLYGICDGWKKKTQSTLKNPKVQDFDGRQQRNPPTNDK